MRTYLLMVWTRTASLRSVVLCLKEAHCAPTPVASYSPAVTEEEIRRRVEEILLKRDLGDALTFQEETILAYAHYAAGEQRVTTRTRSDAEAGE
jgi:hypothetical protein